MRAALFGSAVGLAITAVSASADKAYDTFTSETGFNYGAQYILLPGELASFGFVFESQASGNIQEIVLSVLAERSFRVELYEVSDDGLPGVSLGSWAAVGAPRFPTTTYEELPRVYPASGVRLSAGESYAIVIHSMSSLRNYWAWGGTFGDHVLPLVEFDASGNWISNMSEAGGFKIIVPAPSALAALGACGLIARRRRA